ncbi:MAG TPA: glycosyltransferase family 1 protein [Propionicimonas sp.]|jgi:glycosyltransferase involved in cell wall biosynthesis
MLRVGFDDQIFRAQRRGGASKYFVELFTRLPRHGVEPVILTGPTRNLHLAESGLVPAAPPRGAIADRAEWFTWRLAGYPIIAPEPRPAIDLMHHTFTQRSYLRRWSGPRVVTVFDMTPELFPQYFRLGNPHFAKRRYCEQSDAIIAISQNTAEDMLRLYSPSLRNKTTVVPIAVGEEFFEDGPGTLDLPERYLLYVGTRTGYKHFDTALEAFRLLADDDPGLSLVVVGGGPWRKDEQEAIAATGHADRISRLAPADGQMPELYRRASVFVFPSVYEGFGLPTVESLAAGTPAVVADASCSREVGGDAAQYFTPLDAAGLAATIRRAESDDERARVRIAGPERARLFDWDRVARETAEVYRSLVGR